MESLNVAFFCWESLYAERVGGLASAATRLAESLAKDHTVHFFTRGWTKDQEINGVSYHYCRPQGNNTVQYCEDMSNQMVDQFRQSDRKEKFDILHFHDWHPVQALHRLQDRDTILTFHSTEYGRNGNQYGDWWEYKEISGKEWYGGLIAKKVTAVSSVMKREVMQLYNIPDWKCDVVPNGIVPQQYRASIDPGDVKRAYGIHPYAPLILFIGRLVYQKGPDLFIEALRKVCHDRWDAKVIVAGDGGMRQYLQDRARDLPVNFVGYIPDSEYIRLLNACDLVVIPSRNEPFGLVLLEAWSAEKPVVACDVGGLSENIDTFVNGIKVQPEPDSIAWGIGAMIDDPTTAQVRGRRGRAKVDRQFLWSPIARRMADTYSRACG
ncbi:glycosyl transferase, group 1 [Methanoregula boonei 6A8]|uniref:Glycosyl transferase, group 1 n=1 Tax=Methanoregula boonei (strain DSM 21154 / JCM 14090 / 6A8) TaxID=456442 RepID=A7I8J4_METB6|nr:glycosyltransferase family 4 protein [Methanoregula boonei]ABS56055.1 glycosyl transferase, group 1 [Methanoregula boonei 6A8]